MLTIAQEDFVTRLCVATNQALKVNALNHYHKDNRWVGNWCYVGDSATHHKFKFAGIALYIEVPKA